MQPEPPSRSRIDRRRARRRALAVLVLGTWLVLAGARVRREVARPEAARLAEAAALTLAPGTYFYAVRMGGRSVGIATSRLDTLPDGYRIEDVVSLELAALGSVGTAQARTRVDLDSALVLRTFSFGLDSEMGPFRAEGEVRGDSLLSVRVDAGEGGEPVTWRLDEPPTLASVVPLRVAVGHGLEVGQRVRLPVFDPSTLSSRAVEVEVLEHDTLSVPDSVAVEPGSGRWETVTVRPVPAWRVREGWGGLALESWIDEDGRVLRATSPLGFSMERTAYELAWQEREAARASGPGPDGEGDVILATAIESDVPLPDPVGRSALRVRLTGVDLDGFALDGGRQELRGDTLIVRREEPGRLRPHYRLPYREVDLRDALEAEPLLQSDHPRIRRTARRVIEGSDPVAAAEALSRWVHRRLEKGIAFSVPSALQVLDSGSGDCNEHTALYVALARAVGLPARTAVGLVHVDGAFYYHAWPEVWLGRWVGVDPTLDQFPADASHLRFVVGGLARQVEILRLIGTLDVEVLGEPGAEGG